MTDFTEGPWTFDNLESGQIISIDKEDEDCCKVICDMLVTGDKEWDADAHLVAAAPDMYAMIKEVADMQKQWYGYGMDTHIKLAKMAKKMELILAKARGE